MSAVNPPSVGVIVQIIDVFCVSAHARDFWPNSRSLICASVDTTTPGVRKGADGEDFLFVVPNRASCCKATCLFGRFKHVSVCCVQKDLRL